MDLVLVVNVSRSCDGTEGCNAGARHRTLRKIPQHGRGKDRLASILLWGFARFEVSLLGEVG